MIKISNNKISNHLNFGCWISCGAIVVIEAFQAANMLKLAK